MTKYKLNISLDYIRCFSRIIFTSCQKWQVNRPKNDPISDGQLRNILCLAVNVTVM